MSNLIEGLKDCVDSILEIRESLGAVIRSVSIVTRTWNGRRVGDGTPIEEVTKVAPQPGIKQIAHDIRVLQGGALQQGDLIIYHLSKHQYPCEADVNCQVDSPLVEKFYRVGDYDYRVISVVDRYLTWDVQVRRLSDQSGAK